MRITRKIQSDINYIKNTPKRNQYQYQQHPQTEQIREKRIESIPINKKPLLLQKIQPANCDIIKVQLTKNNIPRQRIYSTKTTNVKSLYNNGVINIKPTTNENNLNNFSRRLSKNEPSIGININKKEENNIDLGNLEKLKKYLIPRYTQNNQIQNIKRRGVISTSPNIQNPYPYEDEKPENNNSKNKNETHKMRYLLSQKFTYNKPKTTSSVSNMSSNKNNNRRHIYDTKTYCNPVKNMKNIDNISVNSFNSNNTNILVRRSGNNCNIGLKLDDLILYDERLNDILTALSNKNDVNDIEAFNECAEFFVFYFHSTLQNKFDTFFNRRNKILIVSANNMILLSIIIIYHLSLDINLFKNVIEIVLENLSLIKSIFYLMVKMIELYYGESYVIKNDFYFKAFNYYLKKQNLSNFKEEDIISKIDSTCRIMAGQIQKILKIYRDVNNIYYTDFNAIFSNISVLTEKELHDYFYGRVYEKCNKSVTKSKSTNDYSTFTYSNNNNNLSPNNKSDYIDNSDLISVISNKSSHYYGKINFDNNKILKMINEYQKTKVEPPFIKTPNNKKYSLVLDLDETLMNLELKDSASNKYMLHLRPGLYSFLSNIKPYYELMTFTSASKEYAMPIIKEIELKEKYFDYNFFREHSVIVGNDFVKDISRIGRDMKKIIIIDNIEENFRLNKKNGIKIAPFYGQNRNETVLYELKKILIMIARKNYEDLTVALKDFAYDIKKYISLE